MAQSENILDVSTAEFEDAVVRRSATTPVLVDFWAPWCGPCRVLGPTLEKLAREMKGAFVLAKVNSDENPELAMSFGVQGIPNVLLVKDGAVVDRFVGVLPESAVRAFLRPYCPTKTDALAFEAARLLAAGDADGARAAYEGVLAEEANHGAALLGLARLALGQGDLDEVRPLVEAIPTEADEYADGQALLDAESLVREAAGIGDPESCTRRAEADSGDVEARYALGAHAVAAGRNREALEHFLDAARADPRWRNEAPRRAMVTVFNIVGARDPLAEEYRDKLRAVYY